jgi:hypothetical protein
MDISAVLTAPMMIPVAALGVGAIAIVGNIITGTHSQRLRAEQRMAMVARGMKPEEIALLLDSPAEMAREGDVRDPMRTLANCRRAGIILCSVGVGLIVFFAILAQILGVREIYSGAAAGLIPLAIGIGFFIDYTAQKRDLARYGLEVDPRP